tara:strand:+ start:1061 stop:1663 length:603 start_codon:yes stop_codon:yes gene_type:complete
MKKLIVLLLIITPTIILARIGENKFSMLIEGYGGIFNPPLSISSNFNKVYGKNNLINGYGIGLGWKNTYLIFKQKDIELNGKSIVSGIDLEGKAYFKETFSILAARYYEGLLFTELGYVINSIKEDISTNQPIYSKLNTIYSTSNNEGLSVCFGFYIPFKKIIIISDINYIYVLSKSPNNSENKINVGGLMFNLSIGINL